MLLKLNDVGGLNLVHHHQHGVTITRIRDKFEVDGIVQDVLKGRYGRKRSSTDNKSADEVKQIFARSPK